MLFNPWHICFAFPWYSHSSQVNWFRPWKIGVGRLVSTRNWWFSGSNFEFTRGYYGPLINTSAYLILCYMVGYPEIIHFNRIFPYKPSLLGYPHFWKPPYLPGFMLCTRGYPYLTVFMLFTRSVDTIFIFQIVSCIIHKYHIWKIIY